MEPEPVRNENLFTTVQNVASFHSGQGQGPVQLQSQDQMVKLYNIQQGRNKAGPFLYVDYENRSLLICVLLTAAYFCLTWLFGPFFELTYIDDDLFRQLATGYTWFMAMVCAVGLMANCFMCVSFAKLVLNSLPLTIWMWIILAFLVFSIPEMILVIVGVSVSEEVNEANKGKMLLSKPNSEAMPKYKVVPKNSNNDYGRYNYSSSGEWESNKYSHHLTKLGLGGIVVIMVSHCFFEWVAWATRSILKRIRAQIPPEVTQLDPLFHQFRQMNRPQPQPYFYPPPPPPGYGNGMGMSGYGVGYGGMPPQPGPGGPGPEYYNYSNAYPAMSPAQH